MKRTLFAIGIGLIVGAGVLLVWLNLGGGSFEGQGRVAGFGDEQTLYIEHEEISDYAPAQTTSFSVGETVSLESLEIGDAIQFQGEAGLGQPRITEIDRLSDNALPLNPASEDGGEGGGDQTAALDPGEKVPDVELVDQDGELVQFSDYRGHGLILTFIYTECPLPDFCPLMTTQFADLQPELKERYGGAVQLLSISFDPENDTPEVLTDYGRKHTDDFSTWTFATGATAEQLERAKEAFGITTIEKEDEIVHNLVTAFIDPDGEVVWVWRGNDWEPDDILQVVEETMREERAR